MKKLSKTKYAILGVLAQRARSGYEIRQFIGDFTNHFWHESDASIYPMLRVLKAEKKICSRDEYVGKRKRIIFEITPAGKKELIQWLAVPAESESTRDELLLKLFFGAHITTNDIQQHLWQRQEKVAATAQRFKDIEKNALPMVPDNYPHKLFWHMVLNNGLAHVKAEERWLVECFKLLNMKRKRVNRGKNGNKS